MARPPKCRKVKQMPHVTYFKPRANSVDTLEEEILTVEELEALRLKDMDGLNQDEAAQRMEVSRPTFVRILNRARQKVTRVLVEGKALRIEGGHFALPESVPNL